MEVQDLDYIDFLILRHDAFIDKLSQTENGTKYLNNAYRLEYGANPDRKRLRELFGKEVTTDGK